MSHQKHHVSARKSISPSSSYYSKSTKYSRHGDYKDYNNNQYDIELDRRSHRRRHGDFNEEYLSPSIDHYHNVHKHHGSKKSTISNSTQSTNSDILRLSQQEIIMLRQQISELQDAFTMYRQEKQSCYVPIPKFVPNCFSFLKKRILKPDSEIEICNSKLSIGETMYKDPKLNDENSYYKRIKSSHKHRSIKKDKKERENRAKQHRITNNNTIVLPDTYAQNSGETMNNISVLLEEHGNEIKEIKDRLNVCVELLRENVDPMYTNNSKFIFDEYIKLNSAMSNSKYGQLFNNSIDKGLMNFVSKKLKSNHAIMSSSTPAIEEVEDVYTNDNSTIASDDDKSLMQKSTIFREAINVNNLTTKKSSLETCGESRKGGQCQYQPKSKPKPMPKEKPKEKEKVKEKEKEKEKAKVKEKEKEKAKVKEKEKEKKTKPLSKSRSEPSRNVSFTVKPFETKKDAKGSCFMGFIRLIFCRK